MDPDILAQHPDAPAPSRLAHAVEPARDASGHDTERLVVPTRNRGSAAVGHDLNGHAPLAMRNGHAPHHHPAHHHAAAPSWAERLTGPVVAVPNAAVAETLAAIDARSREGFYLRAGKRVFDFLGALGALVLTSPLLLLVALAIKLESPGPVFYRSTRIGRGGRPFTFLKLRSMVRDADRHRHSLTHLNESDGPVFKMCRDPRVTRVGRFLRTTSLDEIPQFVNVLVGDMSLVGPRPPIPEEVAQYEPWQLRRLDVLPGITCLWQISGRSRIGFTEWMRLDLEYIKHQSFWLDLKILLRTIPAVLSREGAY